MANIKDKFSKVKKGVGIWTSYYRANPHRLALDYLGMKWLKPVQLIFVWVFLKFPRVMLIASRGFGKTLLIAVAICVKAILYPNIKIVISAGRKKQSLEVFQKIKEFMRDSPNLQNEIKDISENSEKSEILFINGSTVRVAVATEDGRSARSNWVICDEFVRIKRHIVDSVLRKFNSGERTPNFFNKPEYANYPKEPNCETYISSASYKYHYSWNKFLAYHNSMLKDDNDSYLVMGFPYQLPVSQGYYPLRQVIEDMKETDFNSISWSMEMDSLFFGEAEDAFFSFDEANINRILENAIYPKCIYSQIDDKNFVYPKKEENELRLISMDVSTQGGKRNDNTCYTVYRCIPKGNQYLRFIVYMEISNGGHTLDQAIRLKQLFDDFDADYVVVDTMGVGGGVYDNLVIELKDEERDTIYPAWTCINDDNMANRCKDENALKIIYSIKANSAFNSECAIKLKDDLKRKKIKLLVDEEDCNAVLSNIKGFEKMPIEKQAYLKLPYYQTSMFINEMVNLSYEVNQNIIKVKEKSTSTKDRYSSVSYGNYIISQLEKNLYVPQNDNNFKGLLSFRKPKMTKRW